MELSDKDKLFIRICSISNKDYNSLRLYHDV